MRMVVIRLASATSTARILRRKYYEWSQHAQKRQHVHTTLAQRKRRKRADAHAKNGLDKEQSRAEQSKAKQSKAKQSIV
jgi:hypothetical protein